MILIGQYDSPFVRRVAIALALYGYAFEHRPWSTFGDADKIAPFNPLRRVPTLVLDNGTVLIESAYILDYLDEQMGTERALIAASGLKRQKSLYWIALASGLGDKSVSLIYEKILHTEASDVWLKRCHTQIAAVLDALEQERKQVATPWFSGNDIGHDDIILGCALRFVGEAHSDIITLSDWPALMTHSTACEALAVFANHAQAFSPPGKK
jgi:glutathione S-transferase